MELKLPSPEEIYDLSTDQLSKLKSDLAFDISKKQKNINTGNNATNDEIESLKELLENIELEIEERKTIEFFTELCINDGTANKYVKEITDFNNEFKKLANEMLNNQSNLINSERKETNELKNIKESDEHFEHSVESKNEKEHFDRGASQTTINSEDFSTDHTHATETSHFSKSTNSDFAGKTVSKQMGLGQPNMKKNKKSMQDFIKATLAKSKGVDYVSTKGGMVKNTPDKVEKNGSHISNTEASRTPFSTSKSIKPPSQGTEPGSHKSETKRASQSSSKNVPIQSNKSISEKNDRSSLMKKRNEVIEKVKNMKKPENHNTGSQSHPPQPPKKKTTKGMDPKSLVEMVKQEEDSKKKREQEQLEEGQNPREKKPSKKEEEKDAKKVDQTSISTEKEEIEKEVDRKLEINKKKTAEISSNHQMESEFPIKEEINPILSSSDTESDSDSVKGISKQKIKKNSYKEEMNKDQKYCSIPEEEIEESIAALKEIKSKEEKNEIKKNELEVIEIKKMTNLETKKNEEKEKSVHLVEKESKNSETLQKSKKEITHNEVFGKITEEEYNPYGYDEKSDDEVKKYKNEEHDEEKDEVKEYEDNESELQEQKSEEVTNKNEAKKSKAKMTEENESPKNSIDNEKKQSKQKNSKEYSVTPQLDEFQSTKMYNEEYWLHIKEEAESKIQRFKQEKELERKERDLKAKIIEEESKRLKAEFSDKKNHKEKKENAEQSFTEDESKNIQEKSHEKEISLKDDDNDKFIQQQKDNLKKIMDENNINGTSKKTSKKPIAAIIKQPKPSFPKPEFNYLEIYPTFNHLFNVFYTKSEGQAILDIPSIMRETIEMFQTHIDYQKSRKNNFRPAIFLPFDNRNSKMNQFTDARQLLQHAETTYINLKTLIERVEVFNSNIQGEFENCTEEESKKTQFYRVVKTREEVYDIISTSFLRRKGWKELPHGQNLKANWNLFWSWSKPELDMNKLLVFQRINHYPFNKNLSRKDLLYKNIDSFRKTHKIPFPYLPITYNLPKEFTQFSKKFHEEEMINRDKNYWIMKPIGKSRGRGIKLINSLGDLNYLDNIVVQKYIANPLLIDGYKFDMRIYVLVTSFHPLEAFVYREGFARFSTEKYSLAPMDMKNNFVHLTNFAINKDNKEADDDHFSEGSKISLKSLKERVTKMGYSFASVWSQVHEIIIKSLLACSVSVPPFPAAFELFGYDVMIDDKGQCSLIEINSSPSLERSYMIDEIVKQSLIDDIIEIVNPPNFSKEEIINVMNERLSPDFRNNKKSAQKGANVDEEDLIHIARILKYQKMRKYGEMPEKIGLFEMVAPSPMSKDLEKLIKSKSGINAPHNID